MHTSSAETMRSLRRAIQDDPKLIVLANRAPFRHEHAPDGSLRVVRSASGLVSAIEPLVQAGGGTWVAHGGDVDLARADHHGRVHVSAGPLRYRLRYVRVPEPQYAGFYFGFANEALWPLCHAAHVQPVFRASDFRAYVGANRRFARAIVDEAAGGSPLVLVQDYHFALAPRMIRRLLHRSTIVTFWHIPWPHPRVLKTCPWAPQLVDAMLSSDIVGLQTDEDCANFLASASELLGSATDRRRMTVEHVGRGVRVKAYPVGAQWNAPALHQVDDAAACRARTLAQLGLRAGVRLGIGVDRLDYTKGITEKFLAIERLLERCPEWRGRFVFVQVAEPSREALPAYQHARATAASVCERVNARFGADGAPAIVLLERHFDAPDVNRFYRAADLCFVNSLDDGMNLVAKEFVAARADEGGVLVLSEFAGASRQLTTALQVNPYATEVTARVLARALEMPTDEQARRMRSMRAVVAAFDSTWWAAQLVSDALVLREQASGAATRTVAGSDIRADAFSSRSWLASY